MHNPEPSGAGNLKEYFGGVLEHVKDRRVVGLFVASLVTFTILYGAPLTYLPVLMDSPFGAGPLLAGVIASSASVWSTLTAT